MNEPSYMKLVAALKRLAADEIDEMDEVHFVVNHKHDCGRYTGAGHCTCVPESVLLCDKPPSDSR